ncbi:MAG: chlorosome envelope protein B [Chlorobiales bacterium]|nr:chlorosome envelope protein B [Chlorobiales bacterium]
MSNVSINEYQGDLHTLPETIGKLAHYQFELVKIGIISSVNVVVFVGTTSINLAGNVLSTVSQVLQGVLSVFTPKK